MKTPLARPLRVPPPRVFLRAVLWLALALSPLLSAFAGDVNSQEQAIFNYMKNSGGQRRASLTLDPILCRVARARAADMAARHYFAHVNPDGLGPNYLVRKAGYVLPEGYDTAPSANQIESASAGSDSPSFTWNDWMASSPHKRHLLGESAFFAEQTSVGVGFVNAPGSDYQFYWVVLSAPPSGPQLSITSPAGGARLNTDSVAVAGTTDGTPASARVMVRVDTANGAGEWVAASGAKTWTATLSGLTPGINTIRAQSFKADGTLLEETSRNVRYVVLAPVTIAIVGEGTVTRGFEGTTQREVGIAYTVNASPKPGMLFAGWTGAINDLRAAVTFIPEVGGLSLTANFIPNPFLTGVGNYAALFSTPNGHEGKLSLALSGNGSFTGRAMVDGLNLAIKGRFDAQGTASVALKGGGTLVATLTLRYTTLSGTGSITGSIAGTDWTGDVGFSVLLNPTTTSLPEKGRYTLVLTAENVPVEVATGNGAATLAINGAGVATATGFLPDGRAWTMRTRLSTTREVLVYVPLYNGDGVLHGILSVQALSDSDVDGVLNWTRPALTRAKSSTPEFTSPITVTGDAYLSPGVGQALVAVTAGRNNAAIALSGGGFTKTVVQTATLSPANVLTISEPALRGLTAKVNPAVGTFSGNFVHPVSGLATTFRGVVLQKHAAGFGFFGNPEGSGYATLAPAENMAGLMAQ